MTTQIESGDCRVQVYVSTYAKYNAGSLAGEWLNLESYSDREAFYAACLELHKDEADPELMFQDHEGIPEGFISESHIKPELWDWLTLSEDDRELLAVYREHVDQDGDIDDARDAFVGKGYDTAADYAASYLEETGALDAIPENLRSYFDYGAFARDLGFEGFTFARHGGELWVFSPA